MTVTNQGARRTYAFVRDLYGAAAGTPPEHGGGIGPVRPRIETV